MLALARSAAEHEDTAQALVLEDALQQAGWFTAANAQSVYDELFADWPANEVAWDRIDNGPHDWFTMGFRAAESVSSPHGRRFLAAIVTVLTGSTGQ